MEMKREAQIGIMLKEGKIVVRSKIGSLSQAEIALLIEHLDMIQSDLKEIFKKGVRKIKDDET